MAHNHHWQNTTAPNFRACLGCRRAQRLADGIWIDVQPPHQGKVKRKTWDESEHELLTETYPYDVADYGKADRDLRNYWR
jgi:hypothetical protein